MNSNIRKNKAIDIREIAKMYKEKYNEELPDIVDRYGYIHEMPKTKTPEPAPKPKETSHAELMAQVDRLYKEAFPEPKQQPVNENQIKKFSTLLEDVSKY